MEFHSPWTLLLLLILPLAGFMMLRKKRGAAVKFPSVGTLRSCPVSWRLRLRPVLVVIRLACIALLIVALARPRKGTLMSEVSSEGVAIEAVVDRSGSMQAEMDYRGTNMNRLEVVKRVLMEFIEGNDKGLDGRGNDLIGLVSFAKYADTVCPLVLSHGVLVEFLKQTDIVRLRSEDGTAIGDAIGLAAARLKKAEEEIRRRNATLGGSEEGDGRGAFTIKSKIMILLTDGRNNMGQYNPLDAAELAKEWGIKVYTIGIGSSQAFTTVQTPLGSFKMPTEQDLDEGLLQAIAEKTGGFYRRADDAQALLNIVKEIDGMERTEVKSIQYARYDELFRWWALPALCLLALEILASCTVFRKIP